MNEQKNFIAITNLLILVLLAAGIAWQGFRLTEIERQTATLPEQTPSAKPPPDKSTKQPNPTPGTGSSSSNKPNAEAKKTPSPKPADKYAAITSKGLFAKRPPEKKPSCTGVLGDEALINGAWHKVGANVAGWTVKEITSQKVVIEKDGTEVPFNLYGGFGLPNSKPFTPTPGIAPAKPKPEPSAAPAKPTPAPKRTPRPERSKPVKSSKPDKEGKIREKQERRAESMRQRGKN